MKRIIVLTTLLMLNFIIYSQSNRREWVRTDSTWTWLDSTGNWLPAVTGQISCFDSSTLANYRLFGEPIWSSINKAYQTNLFRRDFYFGCEGGNDTLVGAADDYAEYYINGIYIDKSFGWSSTIRTRIPKGVLKLNSINRIEVIAKDMQAGCWLAVANVFTFYDSFKYFEDSINIVRNNCKLNCSYKYICQNNENNLKCTVNSILNNFTFINGLAPIPNTILDFDLVKVDSTLMFGCENNSKVYEYKYYNSLKGYLTITLRIDCSCSPPTCPPPSKVNPFLYNLAGNWQSNNSYAYNSKRESAIANQSRSGEYYKSYNSIMNYNGNYWDIGNNANWISKENNTIIDFNGQTVESLNPLKIPSSGKFAFNKTLTNHIASNAKLEETFFLSNEDNNMFSDAKNSRTMAASNIFAVNEIELPLKPNVNTMWPIISYHGFQNIDSVVRSKDEFHTGFNSLKVLPKTTSNAYAYTNYLFCDYNTIDSVYKDLFYCNSEPTNATGLDITKVTFGGISNLSGCTSLSGSQGNGNGVGGKYSDFTKTILNNNYNRNQNYNLKVDFNLCGDTMDGFCHAYFDWNQDGDFNDNGEVYILKSSRNKALSASKDIVIPSFALPGKTRMRISYLVGKNNLGVYNLPNSSDPCNYQMYSSYGEVEDYTINIFDNYEWVKNKPTFSINSNDIRINDKSIKKEFSLQKDKEYLLSYWVKDNATNNEIGYIEIGNSNSSLAPSYPNRPSNIEGWHKIEKIFKVSDNKYKIIFYPTPNITTATYYDDIRILPLDGTMKGYVYDELSQRLVSELDENNYATFYDYDEEGQLIRIRKETERGIMTIKESRRSFKQ